MKVWKWIVFTFERRTPKNPSLIFISSMLNRKYSSCMQYWFKKDGKLGLVKKARGKFKMNIYSCKSPFSRVSCHHCPSQWYTKNWRIVTTEKHILRVSYEKNRKKLWSIFVLIHFPSRNTFHRIKLNRNMMGKNANELAKETIKHYV